MALTAPQEAALDRPTLIHAYAYFYNPPVVFSAPLVGAVQRRQAYNALEVGTPTVGALADVGLEMTVALDGGAAGRQRVRSVDLDNDRIGIGRSAPGTVDGRLDVSAETVTVYREYRPFFCAPYIRPDNTEQYKDERLYPGDNAAQPPVARLGRDRLIVTEDSTASVSFSGAGSFAVRAGATITAYAWDVDDGTVTDGDTDEAALTVTFPRGARYVSLTVTDSNGITFTGHRLVVVASCAECTPVTIETLTLAPDGNTLSLTVDPARLPAGLPTGAKVLVAEAENYGTPLIGYADRFSGWLADERAALQSGKSGASRVTLTVNDVSAFLKSAYLFPQAINIAEGAGGWYAMPDANIDRLLHFVLRWHTNVLSLCDFIDRDVGGIYAFSAWTTSGGSIWSDVDTLCRAIGHQLTCDTGNTLRVTRDPHVLPSAAQAAEYDLPTQRPSGIETTFTPSRYTTYSLAARPTPTAYWLTSMALLADDTINDVVSCIAPGNAPNIGLQGASDNNLLVTSQPELNVWAANRYASELSPPVGLLTITTRNAAHIIEPALRRYVGVVLPQWLRTRYNLPDDTDNRWTVEEVVYSYAEDGKTARYTLRKEIVASEPARTTVQTEDTTTVQTWTGFDGGIATTTGSITQAFEGTMSLTQLQFEESLGKLTLRAVMSANSAVTDVGLLTGEETDPGGGGADSSANAKAAGGYYEVALRLNQFIANAEAYYADIASDPDVIDLFSAYLQALIVEADPAAATAWATYIDTVDDTFPVLSLVQREAAAEDMYCTGGARAGLVTFASNDLTAMTTPTFIQFTEMLKVITDAQLAAWYNIGIGKPLELYETYACALAADDTLTINAAAINANTQILGEVNLFWGGRTDGTFVRVVATGAYEDDTYRVDSFYRVTKATGVRSYLPLVVSNVQPSNLSTGIDIDWVNPPTYRADGNYTVLGTFAPDADPRVYIIRNGRTLSGTAVGELSLTFTDLGAR